MAMIEVRATVNLPADASGRGPAPGDVVWVDDADEQIDRWIRLAFLVPIVRLAMPDALVPARARRGKTGDDADAARDDAGGGGDAAA